MKLIISQNPGLTAAEILKTRLQENKKKTFVLALPTGGTPVEMYKNIVRMHKNKKIDFSNVLTFNLDEYAGVDKCCPQAYCSFMEENLFGQIDIKRENINIPNGMAKDLNAECAAYEDKIKKAGGIDLFFGGVGENGHIAFNEPGSPVDSLTRVVDLTEDTINVNSRFFSCAADVPKQALTMGVKTILSSREIIILATGKKKAEALKAAFEGPSTSEWIISLLQKHQNTTVIADADAASLLKTKPGNI